MNALFQLLSEQDIPSLLEMMREFYAHQGMCFDRAVAMDAVTKLLEDSRYGQIYLIFRGNDLAGYFVLTFCYSLEFHGRFGLLDEVYLRETFRAQHLGKSIVAFAEELCRKNGIQALRLEVGHENVTARALYQKTGFKEEERNLMTKWL